ncbi:MAG TPA: LysM peptidoglycan-binding domain-containing protein, partial [Anaerolineae bacterium]
MIPALATVIRAGPGPGLLWVIMACTLAACSRLQPVPTSVPLALIPTATDTGITGLTPTYIAAPATPIPAVSSEPTFPTATAMLPVSSMPVASPTPLATPAVYVVQAGDTVSRIAEKFNVDLTTLLRVNDLLLDDLIYPGDELVIPPSLSGADIALPVHYVSVGDTLSGIAAHYGVEVEALKQANTGVNPDALSIGRPLLIPLSFGEVHYTAPGDTLLAIALRYGVSLDELLKANIDVLDPSNPDFVPANVLLTIPPAEVATGYDCSQQPAQTRVITYTVRHGEGLFCLARKFKLSITTLLDANPHLMGVDVI